MSVVRDSTRRCTYVVDPPTGRPCKAYLDLWAVYVRYGTGKYLQDEPLIRCKDHVGETVHAFAQSDYDIGYLDRVERPST